MYRKAAIMALLLMAGLLVTAQIPEMFNYQAVVRDAQHGLIKNQPVSFRTSILDGYTDGPPVYVETHEVSTDGAGIATLVIGDGDDPTGSFGEIPWGSGYYFLKVEVDPEGGTAYAHAGTSQLISVPYALYSANVSSPTRKFTIQENPGHPADSALFEVRNLEGQTVFAVYPEGTRVYVLDEEAKGKKGGFAVGGYSRATKGVTQEYMRVTPDSIRMYVDESATKGKKGGFAVGGYSRGTKGLTDSYFEIKPDSAKFTMVSDTEGEGSSALSIVTRSRSGAPDEVSGSNLFNLTKDNYFIGHCTGESIIDGTMNCFLGYESGRYTTNGSGNIFIGERSGHENVSGSFNAFIGFQTGYQNRNGNNNVAIGYTAGQENQAGLNNVFVGNNAGQNTEGNQNVYIGNDAGLNNHKGNNSIMIGNAAGQNADTSYANVFIGNASGMSNSGGHSNVFIGMHSGWSNAKGLNNTFLGHETGSYNTDSEMNTFLGAYAGQRNTGGSSNTFLGMNAGHYHEDGGNNVFVGTAAGLNNTSGMNNVYIGRGAGIDCEEGNDNVFIGYEAGAYETGDGKLYIDIYAHDSDNALIYGEFYNHGVRINNQLGIGRMATDNALEVAGNVSKSTPGDWLANSDARIKTEVRDIENACGMISRLRPVSFRYTEQWRQTHQGIEDQTYYNYIAQEFAEVFPNSVKTGGGILKGSNDPLLQMDSYPAQVVAIRAIQELIEENRSQQEVIDRLLDKVDALEQQLSIR